MALKDLKHIPLEHDDSGDITSRRVSYEHGDYKDVTDLGEHRLHEEMSELQNQKNEDGGNVYRVEVGVLMTDKTNKDYPYYADVYDHQYGYYDEDQHYEQDKQTAINYVNNYVEKGVDFTYGIIAPSTLDDCCFENGKLAEDVVIEGEDYSTENVIYAMAKIRGTIVSDFLIKPKEKGNTMNKTKFTEMLIEDITSETQIVPVIRSNPGCGVITAIQETMQEHNVKSAYVNARRLIDAPDVNNSLDLEIIQEAAENTDKTYAVIFDEFTHCTPDVHFQIMNMVYSRKTTRINGKLPENIRFLLTDTIDAEFMGSKPLKLYDKITQPL